MDKSKLDFFVSRYSEFDEDALAEVCGKADTLAEEAAAALAAVLAKRGIDRTLLIQRAKENEDPPLRLEPKRNMRLMAAQLVGAAVIIVFAKVVAQNTPNWVGLLVVLGFLGYWLYRWFGKNK
jgi:hypothetical protein